MKMNRQGNLDGSFFTFLRLTTAGAGFGSDGGKCARDCSR